MIAWSQEDVDSHMARMRVEKFNSLTGTEAVALVKGAPKIQRPRMNKTESEYLARLSIQKLLGHVEFYEFEGISLQLAPSTWYTPDFFVVKKGEFQFHETKGFMREAARVRLNVAAAKFPWFKFYLVRKKGVKDGGGWDIQSVRST